MNAEALRLVSIALAIAVLALAFSLFFKKELVQKVKQAVSWLLKISYLDFIKLIIFIRPLKQYSDQVGIVVWLILVLVVGRYLITVQPKINEILGPYIPFIGYVFYLSVLFIIHFVILLSRKTD
jgi:hypothetical protein